MFYKKIRLICILSLLKSSNVQRSNLNSLNLLKFIDTIFVRKVYKDETRDEKRSIQKLILKRKVKYFKKNR